MTEDLFPSLVYAEEQDAPVITATLVDEPRRLNFLPSLFTPRYFIRGEGVAFYLMDLMCKAYTGGLWEFYELSNGSGYMVSSMERATLTVEGNGFNDEMSGDAAGVVITLFALNYLIDVAHSKNEAESEELIERYYGLRDFAIQHAECDLIFAAID